MKLKLLAVVVLGAVGAGALLYAFGVIGASAATTTEYLTSPASFGDVREEIAATGSLAAATRTGVTFGIEAWEIDADSTMGPTPPATYPVKEVMIAVGDTVAEGDVLATADTTDLKDDLARARNDLKSAQVSMRAADDQLDNASTTAAKRQAKIARYSAINQLDQAETAVKDLEIQIRSATLTAPVAGVVTEVNLSAGADAPAGAAVVIDSPTFAVTTDVVESDVASVKLGQEATVELSAIDATVTGKVTTISPEASSGSSVVSYPVTVTLDAVPAMARSGMSADVTITVASASNVLAVPAAALRGQDGDYSVRTLSADGTPVNTPVQVGLVTDSLAEITSGLTEGTPVVTGTAAELLQTTTANGGFGAPGGVVVGGGAFPGGGARQFRQGNGN